MHPTGVGSVYMSYSHFYPTLERRASGNAGTPFPSPEETRPALTAKHDRDVAGTVRREIEARLRESTLAHLDLVHSPGSLSRRLDRVPRQDRLCLSLLHGLGLDVSTVLRARGIPGRGSALGKRQASPLNGALAVTPEKTSSRAALRIVTFAPPIGFPCSSFTKTSRICWKAMRPFSNSLTSSSLAPPRTDSPRRRRWRECPRIPGGPCGSRKKKTGGGRCC